jgi:hypothetical protein
MVSGSRQPELDAVSVLDVKGIQNETKKGGSEDPPKYHAKRGSA